MLRAGALGRCWDEKEKGQETASKETEDKEDNHMEGSHMEEGQVGEMEEMEGAMMGGRG